MTVIPINTFSFVMWNDVRNSKKNGQHYLYLFTNPIIEIFRLFSIINTISKHIIQLYCQNIYK